MKRNIVKNNSDNKNKLYYNALHQKNDNIESSFTMLDPQKS